eukprot:2707817-Alexandrium_andersonii.AAC.1
MFGTSQAPARDSRGRLAQGKSSAAVTQSHFQCVCVCVEAVEAGMATPSGWVPPGLRSEGVPAR